MTNSVALVLGVLVVGGIALDVYLFGLDHAVFLGKKLADLIHWMAFWR